MRERRSCYDGKGRLYEYEMWHTVISDKKFGGVCELEWDEIIDNGDDVSNSLIEKFEDNIDWWVFCETQILTEEVIDKYKERVSWHNVSRCQKLSEPFIEKHKDRVDWIYISCAQQISESFIEKHRDKFNWHLISSYQNLSEEFILNNIDLIDGEALLENEQVKMTDAVKVALKLKGII